MKFVEPGISTRSRGSSVSIVFDYGLDDWTIQLRQRRKDFSSNLLSPDWLLGPPSLLSNGYQGPFLGGKAQPGHDADHSPPSSAKVFNE
jgi:hypothetical protein